MVRRRVNGVPIDQEGIGIEGIRNIIGRLEAGHAVLVFPEGERTSNGKMQPLKPGVALLFSARPRADCTGWNCWGVRSMAALANVSDSKSHLLTADEPLDRGGLRPAS